MTKPRRRPLPHCVPAQHVLQILYSNGPVRFYQAGHIICLDCGIVGVHDFNTLRKRGQRSRRSMRCWVCGGLPGRYNAPRHIMTQYSTANADGKRRLLEIPAAVCRCGAHYDLGNGDT